MGVMWLIPNIKTLVFGEVVNLKVVVKNLDFELRPRQAKRTEIPLRNPGR